MQKNILIEGVDVKDILLSASLMCADFKNLEHVLHVLEAGGIDIIHIDIMDGHFVPNIALSPLIISSIKDTTTLPFDAHLMIDDPAFILNTLLNTGIESITFHLETIRGKAFRLVDWVKKEGRKVGIAINPETSIEEGEYLYPLVDKVTIMTVDPGFAGQKFIEEMIRKIKKLDKIKRENSYKFFIEVDGGINEKSFKKVIESGAQILVLGSTSLFSSKDLKENIERIRSIISSYGY